MRCDTPGFTCSAGRILESGVASLYHHTTTNVTHQSSADADAFPQAPSECEGSFASSCGSLRSSRATHVASNNLANHHTKATKRFSAHQSMRVQRVRRSPARPIRTPDPPARPPTHPHVCTSCVRASCRAGRRTSTRLAPRTSRSAFARMHVRTHARACTCTCMRMHVHACMCSRTRTLALVKQWAMRAKTNFSWLMAASMLSDCPPEIGPCRAGTLTSKATQVR